MGQCTAAGEQETGFQAFPVTLRAAICYEAMQKLAGVNESDDLSRSLLFVAWFGVAASF
jgi:hypothetical protein